MIESCNCSLSDSVCDAWLLEVEELKWTFVHPFYGGQSEISESCLLSPIMQQVLKEVLKKVNLVTRKPVFGVCDQGRLKPACAATEARQA